MLMVTYASLRGIRPDHANLAIKRCLWYWHRHHLPRSIYGQHMYILGLRQFVQAPEARPLPDDRIESGLQQQQQQSPTQSLQKDRSKSKITVSQQSIQEPADREIDKQGNGSSGPDYSTGEMTKNVEIPYNVDWIFPRLRNPSRLWFITSQLVVSIVGIISKFVVGFMNHTQVYNKERLVTAISKRPNGIPLVTVSNHYSCFDDPGIWGILPMRVVCNTVRIRWAMAAHDICFTKRVHALFFMYGKCIPVVRGNGVYQDAINLCIEKCALGDWVHVFPEGKVNMEKEELRLKWGVGRIVYESPRIPIIMPLWHEGMDNVLPNVEPYKLQWRKKVTVNIGEPLDLNEFVQNLKNNCVPEPVARKLITDKIQDAFRHLRHETEKLHNERN